MRELKESRCGFTGSEFDLLEIAQSDHVGGETRHQITRPQHHDFFPASISRIGHVDRKSETISVSEFAHLVLKFE